MLLVCHEAAELNEQYDHVVHTRVSSFMLHFNFQAAIGSYQEDRCYMYLWTL